jgi:hypothetical protein
MATGAVIQITVSSDAAARISQLGLEPSYEVMLDHAQEAMPELRSLEVTLEHDLEEPREPTLVLNMYRPHPSATDDPTPRQWRAWMALAFPSAVCRHFALATIYE